MGFLRHKAPRSPPVIPEVVKYYNLDEVRRDAEKVVSRWNWTALRAPDSVVVLAQYDHDVGKLVKRLVISDDLTATLYLGEVCVRKTWSVKHQAVSKLLREVDSVHKCVGVPELDYQELKCSYAYRYMSTDVWGTGKPCISSLLRSSVCHGWSDGPGRCKECDKLFLILEKKLAEVNTATGRVHPNTPIATMSKKTLMEELRLTRCEVRRLDQLKKELETRSVLVSKQVSEGLSAVIAEASPTQHSKDHEMMELFWKEQKKAFGTDPRGMRWHPAMIRFAIYLHFQSPRAYEALKNTGVIRLPNKSTLRDYTNVVAPSPGFSIQAFQDLKKQANDLAPERKFVALLHDEMSIKADLVFDHNSGDIIGFTNPDSWHFDESMTDIDKSVATHVLVFMVVGVNSHIKTSLGHFPTRSSTAEELYPLMWKAIGYLETVCSLKVISSTSDKASHNQKLYKLHRVGTEDSVYKSANMFDSDGRPVFFISDPPHLMKTIRNNISKSKAGSTRFLWNNGKHILWTHVERVYKDDVDRQLYRTKLTYDHVHLTPSSTMSVRLAVQVLSRSVSQVMATYYSSDMSETAKFFALCNRFFDCMNVRSLKEEIFKRNPDLAPYRSVNDPRFDFLTKEFLGYVEQWRQSTQSRPDFTKAERNKMFLSPQTYEGIVMTVHAFTEATQFLLRSGAPYVLSQDLCQDPLEEHFGRHRGLGMRQSNPTLYKFGYQENQLRLQRSLAFSFNPKGNTAGRDGAKRPITVSDSPLKKIKR